jgi:hypothetical protein
MHRRWSGHAAAAFALFLRLLWRGACPSGQPPFFTGPQQGQDSKNGGFLSSLNSPTTTATRSNAL